jgi:hypothetical protein
MENAAIETMLLLMEMLEASALQAINSISAGVSWQE